MGNCADLDDIYEIDSKDNTEHEPQQYELVIGHGNKCY